MAESFVSWDFKGSGMAELKNIDMKLFYNCLFSGHFGTYIDSHLDWISLFVPVPMEINEITF